MVVSINMVKERWQQCMIETPKKTSMSSSLSMC